MMNYAKYGKTNPFTNMLSAEELKNTDPSALTDILKSLANHRIRLPTTDIYLLKKPTKSLQNHSTKSSQQIIRFLKRKNFQN